MNIRRFSAKQNGFMPIPLLLLVVILVIIGFVTYLVVNSHSDKNSAANSATKNNYTIKQLGVAINLPPALKDLTYSVSDSDVTTYVLLNTPGYETALHKCNASSASLKHPTFAYLARVSGKYIAKQNPGIGNLKQFANFWVSTTPPPTAVCDSTASAQDKAAFTTLYGQLNTAVANTFKSATLAQ